MPKSLMTLFIAAIAFLAPPAFSQDFYISGFGGVSVGADQDLTSDQNLALIAPFPSADLISHD